MELDWLILFFVLHFIFFFKFKKSDIFTIFERLLSKKNSNKVSKNFNIKEFIFKKLYSKAYIFKV